MSGTGDMWHNPCDMQPHAATFDAEAKEAVKSLAQELGFDRVGITSAEPFERAEAVALERVRGGLMDGLPWFHEARVRRGASPSDILPGARSIISVAMSYYADEEPPPSGTPVLSGQVARYARGRDYHGVMQRRLKQLVASLSERIGRPVQAKIYVDTGPMQDRAVAERAGVGWFGKNTNVLTSGLGSWVFLGQIVTDLALEPDAPVKKTCGRCTICIDDCPTGALIAPYVLDNTRCISFLTIELRGPIPRHLRPLVGDWVFGCDICQDVCPVNRKAQPSHEPAFSTGEHGYAAMDLLPLLSMTEPEFRERFAGSAIRRAKYAGMLRNACVALGNIGDPRAVPALTDTMSHESSLVRGHAAWALGTIGGEAARTALMSAQATETDEGVLEEIAAALAAG